MFLVPKRMLYIDSYLVQHKPSKDTPETIDIRPKTDAVLHIDSYL